jgi:hypothetical protein
MRHPMIPVTLCAALLAGCGPPPQGNEVFVSTTPPGAVCTLTRAGKPIATAGPTPAIALVQPSEDAITVACRRPGFATASVTLPARQTWPGIDFFAYGTAPYDYRHRVDIALVPEPAGRR